MTAHDYLAEVELPGFGTCGLHLLGFPECLVRPPHVRQARRLLARYADLRERVDQDDPGWREPIERAITTFMDEGELPEDGLLREVVLADAETQALIAHRAGKGDPQLIRAFGAAARLTGSRQENAVARVRALVCAGRLQSGPA